MFRFSLLVCVSLIFGITAKPYGNKLTEDTFQDTVMSMDEKGKLSWVVEVEPPEDTDKTDYDIDPRMRIWKSVVSNQDVLPVVDVSYDKPEEDRDAMDHPALSELVPQEAERVPYEAGAWAGAAYAEPEEDMDDLYHHDDQQPLVQVEPLSLEAIGESQVRLHLEPEEDMDDLYHKEQVQPALYQYAAESGAPADLPLQRKYSEPEEDFDDLYHM